MNVLHMFHQSLSDNFWMQLASYPVVLVPKLYREKRSGNIRQFKLYLIQQLILD